MTLASSLQPLTITNNGDCFYIALLIGTLLLYFDNLVQSNREARGSLGMPADDALAKIPQPAYVTNTVTHSTKATMTSTSATQHYQILVVDTACKSGVRKFLWCT